jgi:hypothetical protein
MGKSAILAAWLARREAAGAVVPHHFIRRGFYGWDEPPKIVRSLAAQIEVCYPAQCNLDTPPESRLVDLLSRVSARELVPRGERLVLLLDGLDEYDAPPGSHDPLAAFLPHALPRGIRFLCASRPRHPYLDALAARGGELVRLDLDDRLAASDNDATVLAFWRREAAVLGLDKRFVKEAVRCADGNLQHAITLRNHLASEPPSQWRVEIVPRGLEALLTMLWERLADDAVALRGLGILSAAREPLSLDEIALVAGWDDARQRTAFVHAARELLVEGRREDGSLEVRLHHDAIRTYIVQTLGPAAIRGHHAALAQRLAAWPASGGTAGCWYALRHALAHRTEAGDWLAVARLARDVEFLEVKCRALGVHDVEADVARAAEQCRARGDPSIARELHDVARALARESHWLRDEAGALPAQLWNRLRRMGWSAEELDTRLQLPEESAAFVRVRRAMSRESTALLRDLVGHSAPVTACVVTPDVQSTVSASDDKTLLVWDLETGRVRAKLVSHAGCVRSCAITPDGRYVISTSDDKTLKLWDLETFHIIKTIDVWGPDLGRSFTTKGGVSELMNSCVVMPDGLRVIAASDRTLKVWHLGTGHRLITLRGHTLGEWLCRHAGWPARSLGIRRQDAQDLGSRYRPRSNDTQRSSQRCARMRGHARWPTCGVGIRRQDAQGLGPRHRPRGYYARGPY